MMEGQNAFTPTQKLEFLSLNRRRSSARNVPSGKEQGETDVFAGYKDVYYMKH